jgi:long-chain acyl-CoA synthetase
MDRHARKSDATAQQSQMPQVLDQSTFSSATRAGTALANDNQKSPMPLASYLGGAAAHSPNKPAIIFDGRTLSYLELDREAQRRALTLIASGIGPGDRVALHMDNGSELAVSYFACFYAGAIAVPVNTRMKGPEIEYVLAHSGASIYLGQPELFREVADIQPRFPRMRQFAVDWRALEACVDESTARTLPAVAADRPAVILYTSGTTARPKGVVHTHRSLLNAARNFSLESDDIAMIVTPMVHGAAFMTLLASVDVAATAVVVARFDPEAVLDAIARHRGTYLFAMPVMCRALIAAQSARPRDVSSGKRYLAGGDAVPPALQSEFARCFGRPLHEFFGTTETGPIAANWSSAASCIGSFGCAVPGVDIKVVDANGKPVSHGAIGEMIIRSPSNMAGYWNDQDTTKTALRDRWFHTGDLVRQESDGYLWFQGRRKEIIVRGGSNISPQEVEAVLYQHAGVRDAGVIGEPDANWGERVVAFVSRRPGHAVTAEELITFVAKRLAAYKTPEEIVFLDDLPKSAAGKVLRRALQET